MYPEFYRVLMQSTTIRPLYSTLNTEHLFMLVRPDPALDSKPDPDPERLFRIRPAKGPDLISFCYCYFFFLASTIHMYNAYVCAYWNIFVSKLTNTIKSLFLRNIERLLSNDNFFSQSISLSDLHRRHSTPSLRLCKLTKKTSAHSGMLSGRHGLLY